jgi:hypothetical protein
MLYLLIKKSKVLIILLILFLSACASDEYDYEDENFVPATFAAAIEAGVLMDAVHVAAFARPPQFGVVEVVNLYEDRNVILNINFAVGEGLTFQQPYRYFSEFFVEEWDFVREGDVIASAFYDASDIVVSQHMRARSELARAEEDFAAERYMREIELEETRIAIEFATDTEWERLVINLRMLELQNEQFLINGRRALEETRRRLNETEERISMEYIVAPFDGLVTSLTSIREDAVVATGRVIATVADVDSVFLSASSGVAYIFRYGDVFPATIRDWEFDVRVVNEPFAMGHRQGSRPYILEPLEDGIIQEILYYLEGDWDALINQGERRAHPRFNMFGYGIVLPMRAVQTAIGMTADTERQFVFVYEDGVFGRRFVTLAPYRSGQYVYVISGLEAGQKVVGVE